MDPIVISGPTGTVPIVDSRLLPDDAAEEAWNCDLSSGVITGYATPVLVHSFPANSGFKRAYRFPAGSVTPGPDVWLGLPNANSVPVRSPLTEDTLRRVYWSVPGVGAFWTLYTRIASALAPYNLGYIAPNPALALGVAVTGGTTDGSVPFVARSYVHTLVDQYGFESNPNPPSAVVDGPSDGTWTISSLPTTAPGNPSGKNYPTVTSVRLYRTVTGATTSAQFFLVFEYPFTSPPGGGVYVDSFPDSTVALNNTLVTADFANPVDGLDGLLGLPGGMMVGFTGNTVHFCEPDNPHAWPAGYDISVHYDILGFGFWQTSLMIMTAGYPSAGTGNTPAGFTVSQIQVSEPCLARGSIWTDMSGVFYASGNGIVKLNYYGSAVITAKIMTRKQWANDFFDPQMFVCRHRNQYIALIPADTTFSSTLAGYGWILDVDASQTDFTAGMPSKGIVDLNAFKNATCVWNDDFDGLTYVMAGDNVYRWDATLEPTTYLNYRWRSKLFTLTAPVNMGVIRITMTSDLLPAIARPYTPPPLDNGDTDLQLPTGVACLLRLYINDAQLVFEQAVTQERQVFRLPSGFRVFDYQIEVVGRTPVKKIEMATTMAELNKV